uniref:Uncharacterized protein n=1 Tax=Anguilla anguilla TaxID=7936 RepID=A0A0E9S3M8_ANGAN
MAEGHGSELNLGDWGAGVGLCWPGRVEVKKFCGSSSFALSVVFGPSFR